MTLLDLLKDLTYGELASLKIANFLPGEDQSEPDPTRYEQLMSHVNLALREIYKRFFLRSEEHYIQQYEQISVYILDSKYAQENVASTEPIKYIMDTPDNVFYDNVLKIEEVYDEEGNKLTLNDISDSASYFTPTYRSIQVPTPNNDVTFAVQFRAAHPKITLAMADEPENVEIYVPNSLHEAVLQYIAARQFSSMGGERVVEGDNWYQRFEASCRMVDQLGLEVQGEPGIWRFDERGWV